MTNQIRFKLDGVTLPVTKCKKPKFSCHGGRTWDRFTIMIDGVEFDAHLDTTWGEYIYFQYDGSWRKVKMVSSSVDDLSGKRWFIDPFSVYKAEIVTKTEQDRPSLKELYSDNRKLKTRSVKLLKQNIVDLITEKQLGKDQLINIIHHIEQF